MFGINLPMQVTVVLAVLTILALLAILGLLIKIVKHLDTDDWIVTEIVLLIVGWAVAILTTIGLAVTHFAFGFISDQDFWIPFWTAFWSAIVCLAILVCVTLTLLRGADQIEQDMMEDI